MTHDIMDILRKTSLQLAAAVAMLCVSCSLIHEEPEDCEVSLRFKYDYNMEYACSFDPQVGSVDVYVFDHDGILLMSKSARRSELVDGNRMILNDFLAPGTYKVLTIGGLSDRFRMSDLNDMSLEPGAVTLDKIKVALLRNSTVVEDEFPCLWFGESIVVTHDNKPKTCDVSLVRNTNMFNMTLVRQAPAEPTVQPGFEDTHAYLFELVTPEGAVYSWNNSPLSYESVTYKPHTVDIADDGIRTSRAKTCRLFDTDQYRLVVRNKKTLKTVWEYDLIKLLKYSKPSSRPDGTTLPAQEYLDRQNTWNLVVRHTGGGDDEEYDAFTAVAVEINGWILWLHNEDL